MGLFEEAVGHLLDRLADGQGAPLRFGSLPWGLAELDVIVRQRDVAVPIAHVDRLDLARVAVAVEGHDDDDDASGSERAEQRGLVGGEQLGIEAVTFGLAGEIAGVVGSEGDRSRASIRRSGHVEFS